MKNEFKIVILGAGVGGLTAAIALKQKGFKNIHIYERRAKATTIGAGIVLWANATKILDKLDLISEIKDVGGKLSQMQRWTDRNVFLGTIDVNSINRIVGSVSYAISRVDLQKILLKAAHNLGVIIHYNHNAIHFTKRSKKMTVSFENNSSVTADIILGADGRMNSISRKYVHGNNTPEYQNFVNWIGIVESPFPIFSELHALDYWGYGERFGIVPINKYKGYWAGGKSLPLNAPHKYVTPKIQLLEIFANWPSKIKDIIKLTQPKHIKYIEVFDHSPIPSWFKNNVCLIGDSAHAALPTSGQGACQAIEDAWHFASILDSSETVELAFKRFQEKRFHKTASITMAGRDFAKSLFNTNKAYYEQRNLNAQKTDYSIASQNIGKLWSTN